MFNNVVVCLSKYASDASQPRTISIINNTAEAHEHNNEQKGGRKKMLSDGFIYSF